MHIIILLKTIILYMYAIYTKQYIYTNIYEVYF